MMLQRSAKTRLLFDRCPFCNNVLEWISELNRQACWCEIRLCISCTCREAACFNLCALCDQAYRRRFNAERYIPKSVKTVESWIAQYYNNLRGRHDFRESWDAFRDWWYRAHRSYRLHFQERANRFEIHRASDIGMYRLGRMFLIPQAENNLIRDYCGIDRFEQVKKLRSLGFKLQQIEDLTGVSKPTASRWGRDGLCVVEPLKLGFLNLHV